MTDQEKIINENLIGNGLNADHITPLLRATLTSNYDDETIWKQARLLRRHRSDTSASTSPDPDRDYVDKIIGQELSVMHVGLPRFHEVFFGDVAGLQAASEAVFDKCQEVTLYSITPAMDGADGQRTQIKMLF
ncbi:hypothetical protein TrVFT333_001682 [Trichoderma virens FT-333]|nr:hypothetical protein TrVFT333_001682 [Trichoderma virens FT-333]